jgi:preprotein translocase subunit SecF
MDFDFLKPARYFFILSTILTAVSVVLLFVPGPRVSIEFTGGTRMEIAAANKEVTAETVVATLQSFSAEESLNPTVNKIGNGNFVIRIRGIDNATHTELLKHLQEKLGDVEETQYTTIGPTVGETLKQRAAIALAVASLGIILYLALVFRKVPRRYSPWKFGVIAVLTLLHDVMITVGIFVIISHYTAFEVDTLFVTALLTILGYSVNDTIIVFDRIRDNIFAQERKEEFPQLANRSVNQTWIRSCFTSGSTLIMLISLYFLGSPSIKWFALTLVVGIILGTYSSIFVATPLLVYWHKRSNKHS